MTFSEELIKVLEYLGGKIGIAIDWTAANTLPYLQELCEKFITYEIWTSFAWIAFMWGVLLILWIVTTPCWIVAAKKDWNLSEPACFIIGSFVVISLCWSIAAIAVTGVQIFDIITAIYFPEKTIYEFITKAIQTAKGGY